SREVGLLDEQTLTVQREKVADPCGGHRRVERERVGDHGVEVEELDHRKRSEDFLPATPERRRVEYVDHRPLTGADAYRATAAWDALDTAAHVGELGHLLGRADRHVLNGSEAKAPRRV